MRVALLGGSFNPPHIAHQMICLWALSSGRADQVWLVPCFQHAFNKELLSFEHRYRMCELAAEIFDDPRIRVSDVERAMGGESRTLHTLQRLTAEHPKHRFALLIGADILAEKDSWYRFDEIERMVDLLVLGRQGYQGPDDAVVLPAISSTEVRARLADERSVSHLLPAGVLGYIKDHRLYRPESPSMADQR